MKNKLLKKCSRCQMLKEPSKFGKDKSNKDGLKNYCRVCRSQIYYKRKRQDKIAMKFRNFKGHCKGRGLDFTINLADYRRIISEHQECSNQECERTKYSWHSEDYGYKSTLTLDRIDNTKGYTEENIQVLCMSCNSSKGTKMGMLRKNMTKKRLKYLVEGLSEMHLDYLKDLLDKQ